MRLLDRLYQYLECNSISAYAFEHACGLSNGYLGKQFKGKGTVGSAVLVKIKKHYPELNVQWLITGKGNMINKSYNLENDNSTYNVEDGNSNIFQLQTALIDALKKQIIHLEQIVADRESIIYLLEKSTNK